MPKPRISYIDPATVSDAAMLAEFERCAREGTPRPESQAIRAHVPAVFWSFANSWRDVFKNGVADHAIKELCRIYVSRSVLCEFCGNQRSIKAAKQGVVEEDYRDLINFESSTRYDERQKAALSYAEAITWDLPVDDAFWARLHKHFTEPELVEIGYFIALTMGQQRWLRLLDIEHHQVLAGTAGSMAPGFEDEEALRRAKQAPDYWAKRSRKSQSEAAEWDGSRTRASAMGDHYPAVKVAAVQAASVFLDREGSTAKACELIREAGGKGARIIGFPEGFIPAHPIWYHHHSATGAVSNRLAVELFKHSVEIPGPQIEALARAARDADAYVVIGVCEKLPNTLGTMFNTQVYLSPHGTLIGKHQKIMPTVGERLVHMGGFGDTFGAFPTEFGPVSGLICGENSNPLAVFALMAEGTRIHVMSWPNHFPVSGDPLRNRVAIDSQAFAQMSKAFVISACGSVDEHMIALLEPSATAEKFLRDPDCTGGSLIVAPNSRIIAGPMGAEEGILYAECDLELGIAMKLRHDFAGHYNRPDIFHLQINRTAPKLYSVYGGEQDPALAAAREAAARIGMTGSWPAVPQLAGDATRDDEPKEDR